MLQDPHPFLVHFPIVLLPIAGLWALADAWHHLRVPRPGLGVEPQVGSHLPGGQPIASLGTTEGLLAAACAFSILTAATGDSALSGYALEGRALEIAQEHSRFGGWVAWLAGLALVCRILLQLELRGSDRPGRRGGRPGPVGIGDGRARATRVGILRWGAVVLVCLATTAGWVAGLYGGRLVHEEGITRATAPRAQATAGPPDAYRTP